MREHLRGHIASAGFASGDRFVVGAWETSPIGPMVDVMWARPTGERVLLVPTAAVGDYVSSVYGFDRVEVVEGMTGRCDGGALDVHAGSLSLRMTAGRGVPLPPAPPWFVRHVEGPVALALLGVRTYGVSPTGVAEWYRAVRWRPVRAATATLDGVDLGGLRPLRPPPCGFGFSEPPARPSIVAVRPVLERPAT